jgi:signal transduction histidine kinase
VRATAEILGRQVSHLTRQVDDLLDIGRISRGKIDLRKTRVALTPIVRHAVESIRPVADSLGLELTVTVPRDPVYVLGDPVRLTQVLTNLLNNATKFTDHGGRITLTLERTSEQAIIRVADTGIGIPAGDLPRIFEMFAQVDKSPARPRDGLGLGLSVVKNLVELHDGTVDARSAGPGHGSEFVVRLPLVAQRSERALRDRGAAPGKNMPA